MEFERVGSVSVGSVPLKILGEVENFHSFKGTSFDTNTTSCLLQFAKIEKIRMSNPVIQIDDSIEGATFCDQAVNTRPNNGCSNSTYRYREVRK